MDIAFIGCNSKSKFLSCLMAGVLVVDRDHFEDSHWEVWSLVSGRQDSRTDIQLSELPSERQVSCCGTGSPHGLPQLWGPLQGGPRVLLHLQDISPLWRVTPPAPLIAGLGIGHVIDNEIA